MEIELNPRGIAKMTNQDLSSAIDSLENLFNNITGILQVDYSFTYIHNPLADNDENRNIFDAMNNLIEKLKIEEIRRENNKLIDWKKSVLFES